MTYITCMLNANVKKSPRKSSPRHEAILIKVKDDADRVTERLSYIRLFLLTVSWK